MMAESCLDSERQGRDRPYSLGDTLRRFVQQGLASAMAASDAKGVDRLCRKYGDVVSLPTRHMDAELSNQFLFELTRFVLRAGCFVVIAGIFFFGCCRLFWMMQIVF